MSVKRLQKTRAYAPELARLGLRHCLVPAVLLPAAALTLELLSVVIIIAIEMLEPTSLVGFRWWTA